MDTFLGKWKLKKEVNFDNFLKFSGVPWFQRRIAKHNKLKILIETWEEVYIKSVTSPLYNTEEILKLDNKCRRYDKYVKKFYTQDNIIFADVKYKDSISWNEEVSIKEGFLVNKYIWIKNNERHLAVQFFHRE